MKKRKSILLLLCFFLFAIGQAQVSKIIHVTTPGTLSTLLTATELSNVTNLTISGSVDARDFKTMRDKMQIAKLDISNVNIQPYTGKDGSKYDNSIETLYPANEIPINALGNLYYCLKTVVLPNSITSIGDFAFYGDTMLSGSLVFPSGVTSIGEGAFNNCYGLTGSLTFSPAVTRIGRTAFTNCRGFTGSLIIPSSVTTIEFDAFEGCSGFTGTLTIPSSVTSIEGFAFRYCSGFTGPLTIPSTVTTIGGSAFSGCSGFTGSFSIPAAITSIGDNTFSQCSGLTGSLTLHSGLTYIGEGAFNNCSGLTGTLSIPNTVTKIGQLSFASCSGFTGTLKVPSSITQLYYGTFWGCSGLDAVIIPSSVATIESQVFSNCSNLKHIYAYRTYPAYAMNTSEYAFPNVPLSTCILHVPTSHKADYVSIAPWSNFMNIVEGVPAIVITKEVTNLSSGAPTANGELINLDGYSTTQYGIIWSTSPNPTIDLSTKISIGTAITTGSFNTKLTGLKSSTQYYVRAFAINSVGTSYGDDVTFTSNTFKNLDISDPTIVTNKMVDGNTNAAITRLGTLQGVDAADASNVGVTATATYDNANVGINKTITVVYTLTGSAKDKYIAPENYIITNAKISDYITFSPLSLPTPGCEGSAMHLDFNLLTGTPTRYKITFNSAALNAGMKNIAYQDLSNANTGGTLTFSVPNNTIDGTYQGVLKMVNELYIESVDYPFTFTINVSADNIRTKFNDVVLFDNFSNRFTAYQWYKNGLEITGATKQFYVDPSGLIGTYSLKLLTTSGDTLYTCPKVLNISSVKAQVSTFPNPVKENESCTVRLTGLSEEQLKNAKLSVYNMQGICVYKSDAVANENKFNLPVNGAYVGHITSTGIDYVFKLIVVK